VHRSISLVGHMHLVDYIRRSYMKAGWLWEMRHWPIDVWGIRTRIQAELLHLSGDTRTELKWSLIDQLEE